MGAVEYLAGMGVAFVLGEAAVTFLARDRLKSILPVFNGASLALRRAARTLFARLVSGAGEVSTLRATARLAVFARALLLTVMKRSVPRTRSDRIYTVLGLNGKFVVRQGGAKALPEPSMMASKKVGVVRERSDVSGAFAAKSALARPRHEVRRSLEMQRSRKPEPAL